MSNLISVTASTFSPDSREAARMAREPGFAGIMFDAYTSAFALPDLSITGRREFRHMLSSQQIALVGLQADPGRKGFGPTADIDRLIEYLDRAMDVSVALASPLICIDLGPLAEPVRVSKPQSAITAEQAGLLILPTSVPKIQTAPTSERPIDQPLLDSVHAALVELGVARDRYGVTIALRSSLASFAALEAAMLAARCPWFGVDLDPVAILADEWDGDEIFSRLGGLIRHVRARDAIKGTDRRTKSAPIGKGNVEWSPLLGRLDHAGYHGWLTVDPIDLTNRADSARGGLTTLRALFGIDRT